MPTPADRARCYDFRTRTRTVALSLAAALAAALTLPAVASPAPDRWSAVAVPPRASLPVVDVTIGYQGKYVPTENSPIELHARTGNYPFDGYVGWHIAAGKNHTLDPPVISRASLPSQSQWHFSTWMRLGGAYVSTPGEFRNYPMNREVVVEWRNRDLQIIGQRSIGVPPWIVRQQMRPLRIRGAAESVVDPIYAGQNAVVVEVGELSAQAQWYAGFARAIVPLDAWFTIPLRVREAIFASGSNVMFFGIPAAPPSMNAIDRALLPVDFVSRPARVDVPWPYSGSSALRSAPLSWRARAGTRSLGAAECPYIVVSATSDWVPEEAALRVAVPNFKTQWDFRGMSTSEASLWTKLVRSLPSPGYLLREYAPAVVASLLLVVCAGIWLGLRRAPRVTGAIGVVVLAAVILGSRDAIRPPEAAHVFRRMTIVAPGVVDVVTVIRDYGPPLRLVKPLEGEEARLSVTRPAEHRGAEIRTSSTPPGFGIMDETWEGGARARRVTRRQLDTPATIDIVRADSNALTVKYASTIPVDSIAAGWFADGPRTGVAHAGSRSAGEVTLPRGDPASPTWIWESLDDMGWSWNGVRLQKSDASNIIEIVQPPDPHSPVHLPYGMAVRLMRSGADDFTGAIVLPAPPTARASAMLQFGSVLTSLQSQSARVVITGSAGTAAVELELGTFRQSCELSAGMLERVAPGGGLVRVDLHVRGSDPEQSQISALMIVREKRS